MQQALFFYHVGQNIFSYLRTISQDEGFTDSMLNKADRYSNNSFVICDLIIDGIDLDKRVFKCPFNPTESLVCDKGYDFRYRTNEEKVKRINEIINS